MDRPPIDHVYGGMLERLNDGETHVTDICGLQDHWSSVESSTMSEQRQHPRYPADWAARFRLGGRPEWRSCQLIDVSWDGAAIELHGVLDDEPLVGAFELEITSVTETDDGIPVNGIIRHRSRTAMGRVLVGIEFQSLTAEQLRLLQLLVSLRASI